MSSSAKLRKPCDNCPWRVDAPRQYWDPQHFIDIANNCRGDGMNVMMCHKSTAMPGGGRNPQAPPCQGWIRVVGYAAIGVRILVMTGKVTDEEVNDRSPPELFPTFDAMLRANKIRLRGRG